MLENFSFNTRVIADSAHIDKLEIDLGGWEVNAPIYEFAQLRTSLGTPQSYDHRPDSGLPLFQSSQSPNSVVPDTTKLRVRSLTGRDYAPLVSGKLGIRIRDSQLSPETSNPIRAPLSLSLSLNPTRFLVYQNIPRARSRNGLYKRNLPRGHGIRYQVYRTQSRIVRTDEEFSLDGNDNVALTTMSKSRFSYTRWQSLCLENLSSMVDYVSSEIESFRQNGAELSWNHTLEIKLRKVEFYWEFHHHHPTSLINLIAPIAASVYRESRTTHYPVQESTNHNSRSISLSQRRGITVKFYSKTNKRVRIEASIDITKNRDLLFTTANQSRSARFSTPELLVSALETLASHAAQSVNESIELLNLRARLAPNLQRSSLVLVDCVYQSAEGDLPWAKNLLECLAENGGFSALGSPPPHLRALRRLVRLGVLTRPSRLQRGWYSLSPDFTRAGASLRN